MVTPWILLQEKLHILYLGNICENCRDLMKFMKILLVVSWYFFFDLLSILELFDTYGIQSLGTYCKRSTYIGEKSKITFV